MTFAVRIVRGVHQHAVAEEVGDGVGERRALGDLDALKVPAAHHVLAGFPVELRQGGGDGFRVLVDARDPERQPAVPGLERADAERGIAIHHAAADQRRHVAHPAPGMRGRSLQPEVLPCVLAPYGA